jgi:hypothetical protein
MKVINKAPELTYYTARTDDGAIVHTGEIQPGQSFATGLRHSDMTTDYEEHYQHMQTTAIPWEFGLVLTQNGPPVSYGGKLYKVVQDITVNDPNHTPDVTPALFTKLQQPDKSGYPAWEQKAGAHDAYATGDRVTHDNPNDGGAI